MPSTNEGLLLAIGAIFLLIGILGGGFEISAIKIPSAGKYPRIFSVGLGTLFVAIAVVRLFSLGTPSLTTQPTGIPVPPTLPSEQPTAIPSRASIDTAIPPINTLAPPTMPTVLLPIATLTDAPVPPTLTPTNTPVPPTLTSTNTPIPPTLTSTNTPVPPPEPPVGSQEWRQQLEPLNEGTITGVLIAGKFRTQSDLVGMPIDDQRNILIVELAGRTNQPGGYFQSLDNDTLAGVGALLVFFRAAKIRNDQDIKNMSDDGIRNTFIVELDARTHLGNKLQGMSNIELVRLALSIQW